MKRWDSFGKITLVHKATNELVLLGGENMANIKSAIKRVDINNKKRAQNQSEKSEMRSQIKEVEKFVQASEVDNAKKAFRTATKKIDKAVQKGLIHKNTGNRQKARLAKLVNQLGA